ncbi:MAG: universal stress protein [Verrucomicrobiota bacterium]|nr:universal stress protein [Verrucomicrobiota bacterium]
MSQEKNKPRSVSQELHLKKILVPTDFSDPSENAIRYALCLAKHFDAEITLLTVMETKSIGGAVAVSALLADSAAERKAAKTKLRALSSLVQMEERPEIKTSIRTGVAAGEIVAEAKKLKTDLIVIATHGYTGWKHACLGSTAEHVVRTAPCPVFVVREKEHEFI